MGFQWEEELEWVSMGFKWEEELEWVFNGRRDWAREGTAPKRLQTAPRTFQGLTDGKSLTVTVRVTVSDRKPYASALRLAQSIPQGRT